MELWNEQTITKIDAAPAQQELSESENVMNLLLPGTIRNAVHYVIGKACSEFKRDGIILEKNAVITPRRIDKHRELYEKYCNLWSAYPD